MPPIGRLPASQDLAWTGRFRRAVAGSLPRFQSLVSEELGRDAFDTLVADLVPLLVACRWHERRARRVLRPRTVRGGTVWQLGQRHRCCRIPLGHVAIIATWNYPVQLLGIQLVQAAVAGNRITVKPSERTPKTQQYLLQLARESGLDADRLRWTEPTREAGAELLSAQRFDHVVFTGSSRVGRVIAADLGEHLTPSTLELSGSDSAIVLADADPKLAARSVFYAATINGGQTCMAPRRVIVHESLQEPLTSELSALSRSSPIQVLADTPERDRARELAASAIRAGARAHGCEPSEVGDGRLMIIDHCPPGCEIFGAEHFAPLIVVQSAESDDEAIRLARQTPQRLATSVFTSGPIDTQALATRLGVGVITLNDCLIPTGHPGLSLGGSGDSGWGVTRGELGLLAMTRPVFVSRTSPRIRTPLTKPDQATQRSIQRFVRWLYTR